MDLFNRDSLKTLALTESDLCVSMYMPTQHVEAEFSQNPIRFKNLLKETEQYLKTEGLRDATIEDVLAPAHSLLEHASYWHSLSDGMAAFLTPTSSEFFRLPISFDELAVVGERFHLKPLFPVIAGNNRFYLLALSQKKVRLFQGTHYSIHEVEVSDVPEGIADALFYDEAEQQMQHPTAVKKRSGRGDTMYHGQGRQDEDQRSRPQDRLKRYFRQIDEALHGALHDEEAPLVLAGVGYYLPIYRSVNRYKHLLEGDIIAGNPDALAPKELHMKAWETVKPFFQRAQDASVQQFRRCVQDGRGLASQDLREIVPASVYGQVDTLFVPIGVHRWGRFNDEDNTVELHKQQQVGDSDLLDVAAVHAYLNGGTVYAMQAENMPAQAEIAATFRYSADLAASEA